MSVSSERLEVFVACEVVGFEKREDHPGVVVVVLVVAVALGWCGFVAGDRRFGVPVPVHGGEEAVHDWLIGLRIMARYPDERGRRLLPFPHMTDVALASDCA